MTTAVEFQEMVNKATVNMGRLDGIVNGGPDYEQVTDNGIVPSMAKLAAANQLQIDLAEAASALAQAAAITAQAAVNFRATFSEAIADFSVGQYFTSNESGELRTYKRISSSPFYQDQGDTAAPIAKAILALYATKNNAAFTSAFSIATNGSRIGFTSANTPLTPSAFFQLVNNGAVTCGLRNSSYWTGTTLAPYQNNDNSLWETFNKLTSDSANYSWSISAPNAYNDIPAGNHDSGERVGVYGWATSVNVPGEYEHDGRLSSQIGVRGRAGFQGDSNPSPATARIDKAVGVKGEVRNDSPLATINLSIGGEFTNIDPVGIVENNIGVYSNVTLGTVANWSFFGEAGEMFNEDRVFFGEGSVSARQSASIVTARGTQPNAVEFGHPDPTGYGSNLGRTAGSGYPFLALCAEADPTGNTFRTRGKKGVVLHTDLLGGLIFSRVANTSASGQSLTEMARFDDQGRLSVVNFPSYPDNAAAVAGGLSVNTLYKTGTGALAVVI